MFERILITNGIIEFLQDESNQKTLEELRLVFQRRPELNRDLALRSLVLGLLGTLPLEPGAKMGLLVRFVEVGLSLVDWDQVIAKLELDSKGGMEDKQEKKSVGRGMV